MDKKAGGNASAFANYCSKACQRRSANRRRRAVEHQAPGIWRWIEFIQICMTFGGLCAYCHTRIIGQPEPDHVLPLSRGGTNHLTNILPACKACNSSKRDLTLHEWAVERHRRGQDPVRVSPEEPGPSWRHLMPEEDLGRRSKALVA
jgi:5-methylcytosine-specific restriction endonuclease McrA